MPYFIGYLLVLYPLTMHQQFIKASIEKNMDEYANRLSKWTDIGATIHQTSMHEMKENEYMNKPLFRKGKTKF